MRQRGKAREARNVCVCVCTKSSASPPGERDREKEKNREGEGDKAKGPVAWKWIDMICGEMTGGDGW